MSTASHHDNWTCRHIAGSDFFLDHRTGTVTEYPSKLSASSIDRIVSVVDMLKVTVDGPNERLPFQQLRQHVYDFFMRRFRDVN
jgi:hypothetical protein